MTEAQKAITTRLLETCTDIEATQEEVRAAWAGVFGTDVAKGELGYWPLDVAENVARIASPTVIADALVYLLMRHYGDPKKS